MSSKLTDQLYKELKKLAQGGEARINEFIQNQLNNESLVKLAADQSAVTGEVLRQLQRYQEIITTALRIPTKDDVANVAKLVLQLEEKMDLLEDYLRQLQNAPVATQAVSNREQSSVSQRLNKSKASVASLSQKQSEKSSSSPDTTTNPRENILAFLREQVDVGVNRQPLNDQQEAENNQTQEAPIEVLKRRLKNIG
ncbi:hypothetical protein [Metabacillus niabensis]|uniref:Alkylated DNA repair dioxygenase AlkB n=1 Tax=Metabacillus niabensis TaxID=324854 RepID=A0ABT9Z3F1_9BACI|nr:hypothetical protein [Metabacillus niabensis]MDQ0226786.1 alkylated DNA repair dioxygenase AlkB [Metabacillus niabensis]